MTYTQPNLPYEMDALEPAISARTVDFHYNKHEKAYIDNLNRLIQGSGFEDMELEEVIKHANGALFNNASQAWNTYSISLHSPPMAAGSLQDGWQMPYAKHSDRLKTSRKHL